MRITKLKIYGFGQFNDTVLDLADDFQVIYGENEAGKSTLVAFITSLLFGFATGKHRYEMYQPKRGSQYGGEVSFTHAGTHYWLKRVAGTHGGEVTFRNIDTNAGLGKADLEALLQPMNRELFQQIFCFGERQLQAVFNLNRFDLVQRIQRVGAIGSESWIGLTKTLTSEAGELYKPRGRVQPLVRLLHEYDSINEKVASVKGQFQQYQSLQSEAQKTRLELNQIQRELNQLNQQINQYQRLLPIYERYQALNSDPKQAANEAVISADDWREVTQLSIAIKQAQSELSALQQRIKQQTADQEVTADQQFYRDHRERIDKLATQLAPMTELQQQQTRRQAQMNSGQQELAELSKQYGSSLPQAAVLNDSESQSLQVLFDQQQHLIIEREARAKQRQEHQATFQALTDKANSDAPSGIDLKWLIGGVAVIIIALFGLSGILRTVGGVVGLFVAGYGIFKQTIFGGNQSDTDSQLALLSSQLDQDRNQLTKLDQQLVEIESQITQFGTAHQLTGFDTADWLAIQPDLRTYQTLQKQVAAQQDQLTQDTRTLRTYLVQWQFAGDVIGLGGSDDYQLQLIGQFLSERRDESQRLSWAGETLKANAERQSMLQKQLRDQQSQLQQRLSQYQVATVEAFESRYQAEQTLTKQSEQRNALNAQLTSADRQLLRKTASKDDLVASEKVAQVKLNQFKQQQGTLLEQASRQNYQLERLATSDRYQKLLQQRADLQSEIISLTDEWLTKQLLIKWIDQTLMTASQGRQPQIIATAETFFKTLTGERYDQIIFTDQTVQVERTDGLKFDVGELSSGTAEQLYVALRFAFTKVMADAVAMPIIIDDAFVNFDRDRTKRALSMLQKLASSSQVLYFTANRDNLSLVASDQVYHLEAGKSE
ncbi:ATP-binding protein [Secundilactobacillus folii]|uniref:AAA family ATPase n=1 Tax=Secundilactobacillus folii TaxID=2678357 RepID=A0A7X2XYD4_9LACO|nr:AAA family ATPase [Secundilactobacillus folii]MTV82611.1 AAA family ATPase [Secundilactobacillus folii]